jgi:hypothetical protein
MTVGRMFGASCFRFSGAARVVAICAWTYFSAAALAHHSTAPYDLIHGTIIEGRVTRFAWENPHGHIYVDVSGERNAVEHWTIEIDSPGVLRRLGWTKDALKSGDRVRIAGSHAKNGSFNMKALTVKLPDGRKLSALARQEN